MKKNKILGVELVVTSMKDLVDYVVNNIERLKGEYLCFSNVHTTVMSFEDSNYLNVQNNSYFSLPDGGPLSLVMKIRGYREAERITGPDFMLEVFKLSEEKGFKHFFYGSTEDTLKQLVENLENDFPKINIVGTYSPPFRPLTNEEGISILNLINESQADFLWVGLGAPKQEIWMFNQKEKVSSIMLGVGAGFDYHAKKLKRAPELMQKLSLEWLYRLFQEPRRLFKRYFITNSKFIIYMLKEEKGRLFK